MIDMDPTYTRRRLFLHVCPNPHSLKRAYWLNAVSGFEDMADAHEQMIGELIRQVCQINPEEFIANAAKRYESLTGIKYTDVSHFIVDVYVTSKEIKALYVRRDLNFVPKNTTEPLIEYLEFRSIPLIELDEAGQNIRDAVILSKTTIRNTWWSSLYKTVCYTYVPTHYTCHSQAAAYIL